MFLSNTSTLWLSHYTSLCSLREYKTLFRTATGLQRTPKNYLFALSVAPKGRTPLSHATCHLTSAYDQVKAQVVEDKPAILSSFRTAKRPFFYNLSHIFFKNRKLIYILKRPNASIICIILYKSVLHSFVVFFCYLTRRIDTQCLTKYIPSQDSKVHHVNFACHHPLSALTLVFRST